MFGRTSGHAVTPLVERSRVGANIGQGLMAGAAEIGKAITASKQAKADHDFARQQLISQAKYEQSVGGPLAGEAENMLALAESGSTSQIAGAVQAYLGARGFELQRQMMGMQGERLKLAQQSGQRSQEQHDASMAAAPAALERQEATTRMINAQADGYELSTAGKLAEIEATMAGRLMPAEQRKAVGDAFKAIRAEPAVKKFDEATGILESLRANATSPERSGPMDIGLIFNFMRALDPGSTVREGEFATAQNSGSIPTSIYNAYNKALSGEMLTPEQVGQFLGAAEKSVQGFAKTANKVRSQHMKQLENLKVDSSLIAVPEFKVESSTPPSFDSVEAAEAAGLKPGDKVTIGGVTGTLQ